MPSDSRYSDSQIGQEAGEWLADLEQPDSEDRCPDPAQRREAFVAWLSRSPQHARIFSEMVKTRRRLRSVDVEKRIDVDALIRNLSSAEIIPLYNAGEQPQSVRRGGADSPEPSRRSRRALWGMAAALLIATLGAAIYFGSGRVEVYSTAVGEQHVCKLEDGSVVALNTHSRLEVKYSRHTRDIRLVRGEALFTVEHDSKRPFVVTAGQTTVRAVGTMFNVRRRSQSTDVAVVEGAVQVATAAPYTTANLEDESKSSPLSPRPPSINVKAGEEARVQSGRVSKRTNPQLGDGLAWRERRLVFREAPLAEVAAEFNRYNRVQIHVEGGATEQKKISGIFDADRPQAIVLFALEDRSLDVQNKGTDWVIRPR